ncbi:MAG: DUF1513 domain-containing protein [Bdellovibrionales bacterium]|nr:DUF1513 domain-containing protein [Bdellovibrionales bacterium]
MKLSRRHLLMGSVGSAIGATAIFKLLESVARETAAVHGRFLVSANSPRVEESFNPIHAQSRYLPRLPGSLSLFDVSSSRVSSIDLGCFPHSVVQSPIDPDLAVAIERWNSRAVFVDLKTQSLRGHIDAPEGHYFYGHGVFSHDGQKIYISGVRNSDRLGFLFEVNPQNLIVENQIPTGGYSPHDCLWLDHQSIIVANSGHSGQKPVITVVDSRGMTAPKVYTHDRLEATHLIRLGEGPIICASGFNGGVYPCLYEFNPQSRQISSLGAELAPLIQHLKGEALSLAAFDSQSLFSTVSFSPYLLEWNLKKNSIQVHKTDVIFYNLSAESPGRLLGGEKATGDLYRIEKTQDGKIKTHLIQSRFANASHSRIFI